MIQPSSDRGARRLQSLFGVPWNALELADVARFLADAGDEGLTWEAKAERDDALLSTRMISEEVCGFANSVGGYLILGASQREKGGSWDLPGFSTRDPEPKAWVSRVLCDRLRPVPRFDVEHWALPSEKHVVVVRVEPIAVSPCLTIDGQAYERVTSQTKRVDDPRRLADLLRRGEASIHGSEQKARAAADLIDRARVLGGEASLRTRVTLGLSATGYTPDISARLFSRSFMQTLDASIVELAQGLDPWTERLGLKRALSHSHTAVEVAAAMVASTMPEQQELGAVASWDGSLSLTWVTATNSVSVDFGVDHVLRLAWDNARILVGELGGYGPGHLTIRTISAGPPAPNNLVSLATPVERKITLEDGASLDMASVKRELLRASGVTTFEP